MKFCLDAKVRISLSLDLIHFSSYLNSFRLFSLRLFCTKVNQLIFYGNMYICVHKGKNYTRTAT